MSNSVRKLLQATEMQLLLLISYDNLITPSNDLKDRGVIFLAVTIFACTLI
jgi:hypothetical protein